MIAEPGTGLDLLCVNVLRGLAIDAVQKANSGHPGMPMGAAPMAFQLWRHHLKFSPTNPKWFNRDRFILSAGHGSMLLYGLLHLFGFDLGMDDLKSFRQWGSRTPGHPENTHTPGVEMATGPLGQGVATSVGIAIAESYMAAKFNRPGANVVDHYTYAICGDGDLMEGVAQEAASLAGHLALGKLIWLYDDNGITIDGKTDLAFTEDTASKFQALGWHVQTCDGMDMEAVDRALVAAKAESSRPSLIMARTTIGFGAPNKAGTSGVHGSPLGAEELKLTKAALGLPEEEFYCPAEALRYCQEPRTEEAEWLSQVAQLTAVAPDVAGEFQALLHEDWNLDWSCAPQFEGAIATRNANGAIVNAMGSQHPALLGGSADLTENVFTAQKSSSGYQSNNPLGRNLYYGVREHAMAAAANGITLHGGRGVAGTFLIFSDYCRPSIRLAALMHCPTIFCFSHDSIGLGEDGPTHQPIEQIMSLRLIPNLNVFRPADGRETAVAWMVALSSKEQPTVIVTSRQALPQLTPEDLADHPAHRGGYVLVDSEGLPDAILVATGSEVALAVDAAAALSAEGIATRVASLPSWSLFEAQPAAYRASVLVPGVPTVSIEAGTTIGWAKYADASIGLDHFGASAPGPVLFEKFGFTVEAVVAQVKSILE